MCKYVKRLRSVYVPKWKEPYFETQRLTSRNTTLWKIKVPSQLGSQKTVRANVFLDKLTRRNFFKTNKEVILPLVEIYDFPVDKGNVSMFIRRVRRRRER